MNIVLLGAPGAGKGTQASWLHVHHGFSHLSTGDMLRSQVASSTPLGEKVKAVMESGGLVPDSIMLELIASAIQSNRGSFVLDGYPRTISQAESLDKVLGELNVALDKVILIEVNEGELVKRVGGRFTCQQCLTGYHTEFKPTRTLGVCDVCGSTEFVRRSDDSVDTIKARLEIFRRETEMIIPYYEQRSLLARVNGMVDIDEVTANVEKLLGIA